MLANLISHTFIRPVKKIKIENFHVFDIHWLYRTSRYAIDKVDVTERNYVTKHDGHNMADVCNRSDCIIKNPLSEMEGMQEKEFNRGVNDRYISVPRNQSLTSLGKPRDARQ